MTETDLILQWSLAAIVGFVLLLRRQLTLFHPTTLYLAFHVVAFCIRPTLIHGMDLDSMWKRMEFVPDPEHLRHALLVSSSALVVFVAAFSIFPARAVSLDLPEMTGMDGSDIRALVVTAIVFVPIGVYAIIDTYLPSAATATNGYAGDFRQVLMPVTLLLLIAARWRWWSYLPFVACTAFRNHTGVDLWTITVSTLLLILVWLWSHRRQSPSLIAITGGTVLVVLTFVATENRSTLLNWFQRGETQSAAAGSSRSLEEQIDRPELAAFDCLTYVVAAVPEKSKAFSLGVQHLVPRSWPGFSRFTQDSSGDAATSQIDLGKYGNFSGLHTSLAADGWISGGWIGLALTMAVAGGGLGFAFSLFARNLHAPGPTCFFLIIHATIVLLYLDSSTSVPSLLVFTALPLFSWTWIARRMRAARAAEDERQNLRGRRERRRVLGHAILNPDAAAISSPSDSDDYEDAQQNTAENTGHGSNQKDTDSSGAEDTAAPRTAESEVTPSTRPQPRWRNNDPR